MDIARAKTITDHLMAVQQLLESMKYSNRNWLLEGIEEVDEATEIMVRYHRECLQTAIINA